MKKREFLIAGATTCASAVLSGCVVQPQRPEQTLSNSRLRGLSGQELAEARMVRQMFMAFSDTKKLPMRTYLTMEAQQLERTIAQMPKVMNDVQMAEVGKQVLNLLSLYETAKARG